MRSLVVVAFALVLSSFVSGQTPPRPQIDEANLEQRVAALEGRFDRIETLLKDLADSKNSAVTVVDSDSDPTANDDFKVFQRVVETRLQNVEEKLSQIADRSGALGSSDLPEILAAMQKDPAVREEFFKATNGRFEVHNDMGEWMSVRLNGQQWRFPPGISSISIPFGVVQVQLVDGGDRHTFDDHDWRFVDGEHLLKMGITTQLPQQE